MRVIGWIATIAVVVFVLGALAGNPSNNSIASEKGREYAYNFGTCSRGPVRLPVILDPPITTLAQCRAAVRKYIGAMLQNLRVVVYCREEYVNRMGSRLPAPEKIRANNRQILAMIPDVERGMEQELAKNNTLPKCNRQLNAALQMPTSMKEFRGEWRP
jgi:hypothetical protein